MSFTIVHQKANIKQMLMRLSMLREELHHFAKCDVKNLNID